MVAILRASQQGDRLRYPSKHELTLMAERMVECYPMLQDKDKQIKHVSGTNSQLHYGHIYTGSQIQPESDLYPIQIRFV